MKQLARAELQLPNMNIDFLFYHHQVNFNLAIRFVLQQTNKNSLERQQVQVHFHKQKNNLVSYRAVQCCICCSMCTSVFTKSVHVCLRLLPSILSFFLKCIPAIYLNGYRKLFHLSHCGLSGKQKHTATIGLESRQFQISVCFH